MRKWRKTSSFEIPRAIIVVREGEKAAKGRVARVDAAIGVDVVQTNAAISEGAIRIRTVLTVARPLVA